MWFYLVSNYLFHNQLILVFLLAFILKIIVVQSLFGTRKQNVQLHKLNGVNFILMTRKLEEAKLPPKNPLLKSQRKAKQLVNQKVRTFQLDCVNSLQLTLAKTSPYGTCKKALRNQRTWLSSATNTAVTMWKGCSAFRPHVGTRASSLRSRSKTSQSACTWWTSRKEVQSRRTSWMPRTRSHFE